MLGSEPVNDGGASGGGGESSGGSSNGGATSDIADLSAGALDSDPVHILGTLFSEYSKCGAVALVSSPTSYVMEVPSAPLNVPMGLVGTSLYYIDSESVRRFTLDRIVTDAALASEACGLHYADNDRLVNAPCDTAGDNEHPSDLRTGPDGDFIYQCSPSGGWYKEGKLVYDGPASIEALGHNGLVLVASGGGYGVIDLGKGTLVPSLEPDSMSGDAFRAAENGFLVARGNGSAALWSIEADGAVTSLGEYPELPLGTSAAFKATLASNRELYNLASYSNGDASASIVVVRRTLSGESEIVHGTDADAVLKLSELSSLLTGP